MKQSGFSEDLDVDEEVWEKLVKKRPSVKKFKMIRFPKDWFDLLENIFGDAKITGEEAQSLSDMIDEDVSQRGDEAVTVSAGAPSIQASVPPEEAEESTPAAVSSSSTVMPSSGQCAAESKDEIDSDVMNGRIQPGDDFSDEEYLQDDRKSRSSRSRRLSPVQSQ
eukprot:TRINITY_DN4726_c0_g1_i1.p1 TRINITY_DN4726_c0_g1~~TRINITY_DN4726_c0_g1_i1.p1  ORF type:complete len:165 (-),score=56.17 TRINITY_DN4726_c0_g1_i1:403-897(-)